jgi:23S rRNA pseudouridine1911/1915/1917 synthase
MVVSAAMTMSQRARATMAAAPASAWGEGCGAAERLADVSSMPSSLSAQSQMSVVVAAEDAGGRLDRVLAAHIAELSRSRLKALIEAGAVAVDGRTIRDPSHRVNAGAAIALDVPEPQPAAPHPEAIPLTIVYEDDDIIVIDKPKNLVVHPAAGHWTGTLVNALIAHCGASLSGIGGERRPGIVHRLDKDTTGLMIVAKNDRAHRSLAAQFASHGRDGEPFERGYLAFVWGAPDRPQGIIDKPLDRSPRARDQMAVREGGREAVTHWQALERYAGAASQQRAGKRAKGGGGQGEAVASLLACRLETGRTHQIRVHLASIGHPLLGDPTYGAGFRTKSALLSAGAQAALADLGRQALHAHILTVKHPSSGEILTFRSELPPDLTRLQIELVRGRRAESSETTPDNG